MPKKQKPPELTIEVEDKDGNFVSVKIREEDWRPLSSQEDDDKFLEEFFEAMDEGYPI